MKKFPYILQILDGFTNVELLTNTCGKCNSTNASQRVKHLHTCGVCRVGLNPSRNPLLVSKCHYSGLTTLVPMLAMRLPLPPLNFSQLSEDIIMLDTLESLHIGSFASCGSPHLYRISFPGSHGLLHGEASFCIM